MKEFLIIIMWHKLAGSQKVSLLTMFALLITLPLGVMVSLSPTRLSSKAFLPITPPITEGITPTPSVTGVLILNSASGKSCKTLCEESNLSCQSVGTDIGASNEKSWQFYRGNCAEIATACDGKMKKTANKVCGNDEQPWTLCSCK